jgi:hypothetical protein
VIPPLADLAVTLELLPERLDLPGFSLMMAGLGGLTGSAWGVLAGASTTKRAQYSERFTLGFGVAAIVVFIGVALGQEVS